MATSGKHRPVLLSASLDGLRIVPGGFYVDATYGRGGHSREILRSLDRRGRLLAFDKDPEACAHAARHFADDPRFEIRQGPFTRIAQLYEMGMKAEVEGILFDLGVSSPQLEDASRGFSFSQNGPLDMRMDNTTGISAAEWLASAPRKEIERVLREYGEGRQAAKIAKRISGSSPLRTTRDLASLVASVSGDGGIFSSKNPATRTFLAIRLYINRELEELSAALASTLGLLRRGGRLVVISFHSLEDRIIKQFIHGHSKPRYSPLTGQPLPDSNPTLRKVGGLIRAGTEEVVGNPRARSARLRVAERL